MYPTQYKLGTMVFVETGEVRKPMREYYLEQNRPVYQTGNYYEGPMNSEASNILANFRNNMKYPILRILQIEQDPLC